MVEFLPSGQGQAPAPVDLEQALLDALQGGPCDRDALVATVGRARTTVYDALKLMIQRDIVKKYKSTEQPRGRPRVLFELVAPAPNASGSAKKNEPAKFGHSRLANAFPCERGKDGKAGGNLTLSDVCRYPGNDCNDACPLSVEDCMSDLEKARKDPDRWLPWIAHSREVQCEFAQGYYCTATAPVHVCDLDHNTFKGCPIRAKKLEGDE